jgi:MFS family permease
MAIALAFQSSPYIGSSFAGPRIGQAVLHGIGWRWGFKIWAILTAFVSFLAWIGFIFLIRKGKKHWGIENRGKSGRTALQSIYYWSAEFDGE